MTRLSSCRCGSFVPPHSLACPHCGASVSTARGPAMAAIPAPLRALAAIAGGGAMAMTLSACYGAPCVGRSCGSTGTCDDPSLDIDGDGYCGEFDCDEEDPSVHWGAMDATGDGKDNDCDGSDSMSTTGIRPTPDAGAPDGGAFGDAG